MTALVVAWHHAPLPLLRDHVGSPIVIAAELLNCSGISPDWPMPGPLHAAPRAWRPTSPSTPSSASLVRLPPHDIPVDPSNCATAATTPTTTGPDSDPQDTPAGGQLTARRLGPDD